MSICIKHLPVLLSQALIFNMTDTCVPFSLHHDTLSSKKRYLSHTAAILARSLWCFSIICNWLYIGTFQCLLLLQKVQNAAPGLVCNKHWKIDHILKLNWLLVKGRISMNTAGLACKGLHDQNFPYQLKLLCKIITWNSRAQENKKEFQGNNIEFEKVPYLKVTVPMFPITYSGIFVQKYHFQLSKTNNLSFYRIRLLSQYFLN